MKIDSIPKIDSRVQKYWLVICKTYYETFPKIRDSKEKFDFINSLLNLDNIFISNSLKNK